MAADRVVPLGFKLKALAVRLKGFVNGRHL
jgi:hypothetical protein